MTPKSENMRIWDALGKTDPAHTKQFTRAGGFKGTAIKPMWANKQMTEFFGPCGIGWGMTEPNYQVVEAGDEIMVYCTAGLWYLQNGQKQGPVYGQGGDKVLSQIALKDNRGQRIFDTERGTWKTYAQTDDEAFKKAYTDALSNAMKFIGVAADVHMGLFDDNKYVQQVRDEFEEQKQAEVEAEIQRQKENPSKDPAPTPINQFDAQAKASLAKIEAEKRAASERNAMAEQAGEFHLDGDILTCKIIGIQKKQMGPKTKTPGKEFRSVTFNGRLPNGANFASVFDTELYEPLDSALDHTCKLKIGIKGVYVNIDDVLWIEGVGHGSGIEPFMEPA